MTNKPQAWKESLKQLGTTDEEYIAEKYPKSAQAIAEEIAAGLQGSSVKLTSEGWTVHVVGPLPAYIQTREAICPISENVSLQFKWLPEGGADISISFHAPRGTARQLLEECRDRPLDWTIHVEKKEAND